MNDDDSTGKSNAVESMGAKQECSTSYLKSRVEALGSCYELEGLREKSRGTKRVRSSSETQYHIFTERKRRQDITQKLIALSATTIPGLKKIDKASILGEAINYVRQLQQRIAKLEKKTNDKQSKKSLVITKSCDYYRANEVFLEVEARGLEKEVLIRIYCEKRKGIMIKLLALMKDVHLSIAYSTVLPFGDSIVNIIIISQMSEKYKLSVKDLVMTLKQGIF